MRGSFAADDEKCLKWASVLLAGGYAVIWARPEYSIPDVNVAGKALANRDGDFLAALDVVGNWRASHSYPLNTLQLGLRTRTSGISRALVAQRLKRVSSIIAKLRREPDMKLSQMQDIGGCRAVVDSIAAVHRLRDSYLKSRMKHKFAKQKDYIAEPKESGYRSIHLVYRYYSHRNSTWNGKKIEIQLRSRLQHAWATAVETVGMFLGQALKASEGDEDWLEFMTLVSSAFALLEKTPTCPGTPSAMDELKAMIRGMANRLNVETTLSAWQEALRVIERPAHSKAAYFLLALDHQEMTLAIRSYKQRELQLATEDYGRAERELEGRGSAVLASAGSAKQLKRAYPSYYSDTDLFLEYLRQVIA